MKELSVAEDDIEEEEESAPLILELKHGRPEAARWAGGRRVCGGSRVARLTLQEELHQF